MGSSQDCPYESGNEEPVDAPSVSHLSDQIIENSSTQTDVDTAVTCRDISITDGAATNATYNPELQRVLPDAGLEADGAVEDEITAAHIAAGREARKRTKSKPKSKRTAKAGTGFEEFYVDAPLTSEEHENEKRLYHMSIPLTQRIETAVQRYTAKRNMDSTRKNIFDKFLIHGGIDAGPKMFSGGLDCSASATADADDIALLKATNFVSADKLENGLYVVDFEGCLKAFLSYNLPNTFNLQSKETMKSLVSVVRNFLNYLLYHDVCPEHAEQIHASKRLCDQAERELWAVAKNTIDLPGDFNKACSEIFGGHFQGQWADSSTWLTAEEIAGLSQGISPALAREVFKIGFTANATPEQFEAYKTQSKAKSVHIIKVEDVSMEVVKATAPSPETQTLYTSCGILHPVGKLLMKTWHTPFAPNEDLTEIEELALASALKDTKYYEFWVEDEIVHNCFPGMKLDATVTELSIGVSYFDAIQGIYCSFFHMSANERMNGWRELEGDGNWLPMRATGSGELEDESAKRVDDADIDDIDDGGKIVGAESKETAPPDVKGLKKIESRLEQLSVGKTIAGSIKESGVAASLADEREHGGIGEAFGTNERLRILKTASKERDGEAGRGIRSTGEGSGPS